MAFPLGMTDLAALSIVTTAPRVSRTGASPRLYPLLSVSLAGQRPATSWSIVWHHNPRLSLHCARHGAHSPASRRDATDNPPRVLSPERMLPPPPPGPPLTLFC